MTGSFIQANAAFNIRAGSHNDVVDIDQLTATQNFAIEAGSGNDSIRLMGSNISGITNISPPSGNNVVDLQGNTFEAQVTVATTNAHLGLRVKNNAFSTASFIASATHTDDVFMDDGTSTFNSPATKFNFDDITNHQIDAVFANLMGLLFS